MPLSDLFFPANDSGREIERRYANVASLLVPLFFVFVFVFVERQSSQTMRLTILGATRFRALLSEFISFSILKQRTKTNICMSQTKKLRDMDITPPIYALRCIKMYTARDIRLLWVLSLQTKPCRLFAQHFPIGDLVVLQIFFCFVFSQFRMFNTILFFTDCLGRFVFDERRFQILFPLTNQQTH
jgi:hypothetical protein